MDFRLKVFLSVARNLNFTRAASELHISQPAISRHIQELETAYKIQLFERMGSKTRLTLAGHRFMTHAQEIIDKYNQMQFEMNLMTGNFSSEIRIGASSDISQYILPQLIADYISVNPDVRITLETGNSDHIEKLVEKHHVDIGLIERSHKKQTLKYTNFAKNRLVLVTNSNNKVGKEVTMDQLTKLPLVLREEGSEVIDIFEEELKRFGIHLSQLNIAIQMGSDESIKQFLERNHSTFAVISRAAITKELMRDSLRVIEIVDLPLELDLAYVEPRGVNSELNAKLISYIEARL